MAEKTIKLEPEVIEVLAHIQSGKKFLLSGGAGSGKTYSLVSVIKEVIKANPITPIACITYTNAAVKEIAERVDHPNLRVSTIHDFLWDTIKSFQRELKVTLLELINDPNNSIPNPNTDTVDLYENSFDDGVQYREYLRISDGIISHDEVLALGNQMYRKYKVLCDILKDKYRFIFIDEYQDTSPLVVDILLTQLKKSLKKCIIGFFGNSMQSIYDDGVGDLFDYLASGDVVEVQKKQNRRNPMSVIDLANQLRIDTLRQEPSKDIHAPNMIDGEIKQGSVKFLYAHSGNLTTIKKSNHFHGWDFNDSHNTKELNLTHNLIASKAGFEALMEIYDRDPIIKLKKDIVKKIKEKSIAIDEDMTFEQVVNLVSLQNRQKKLRIDVIKESPEHSALFDILKDKPFSVVRKIYLDKDSLIDDKKDDPESKSNTGTRRDPIIKQLFKIQDIINCYEHKDFNTFIKKTNFRINSIAKKKEILEIIQSIYIMSERSIADVIDYADTTGLCRKDDRYNDFIANNEYLYFRVSNVKFKYFQSLYCYLEGYTPFSTQHKVKGSEYNNVFVILDNGKWNDYNFAKLLGEEKGSENALKRTQKIFYVCCTRAKENLIVYYDSPSDAVLSRARTWFGEEKVICCDSLKGVE